MHDVIDTVRFGTPLKDAKAVVILVHGRGSSAEDMAGLARALPRDGVAYWAPEADGNVWYPQRFIAPLEDNEPWLTGALGVVGQLVAEAAKAGFKPEQIGLVGFSQGACLSLEYAARHPGMVGFVGGLSGGLIGPIADLKRRPTSAVGSGGRVSNLETPAPNVLLGCAENDAHIPLEYVEASAEWFEKSGAQVTRQIYPGTAHTVFPEEIRWLTEQVRASVSGSPAK